MRTEDPAPTEPRTPTAARHDDASGGDAGRDAVHAARDAAHRADRYAEPDDRAPEEQGYGYGV